MPTWEELMKGDVFHGNRLLVDGREIIKSAEPSAKAIARETARAAGNAKRLGGPTATLRALQVGQAHVFPQYVVRSQIATQLGRIRATFACTTVAEGLRVERTL